MYKAQPAVAMTGPETTVGGKRPCQLSPLTPTWTGKTWRADGSPQWNQDSYPWHAFDGDADREHFYHTARGAYENGEHKHATNLDGNHKGEWISLEVPDPFVLHGICITDRLNNLQGEQSFQKGWVLASNDGKEWTELCHCELGFGGSVTKSGSRSWKEHSVTVEATEAYTHFAFVFETAHVNYKHHKGGMICFQQMRLYGSDPKPGASNAVAPGPADS